MVPLKDGPLAPKFDKDDDDLPSPVEEVVEGPIDNPDKRREHDEVSIASSANSLARNERIRAALAAKRKAIEASDAAEFEALKLKRAAQHAEEELRLEESSRVASRRVRAAVAHHERPRRGGRGLWTPQKCKPRPTHPGPHDAH